MKELIIKIISAYQKTVSPDHSQLGKRRYPYGYCRYYPSCSEYSKQAIVEHGLIKGVIMGFYRIIRCNPFSKGGHDPVLKREVKYDF